MDLPLARVCKWLIMVVNSFTQAAESEGSLSHVICNIMLHGGIKQLFELKSSSALLKRRIQKRVCTDIMTQCTFQGRLLIFDVVVVTIFPLNILWLCSNYA